MAFLYPMTSEEIIKNKKDSGKNSEKKLLSQNIPI